jgi:ADP-ribose pyrophosphatase
MNKVREWTELRREPVADCRVFSVERSWARSPEDGSEHDYYRILSVDWAQVVPVTADGDIVMIRQYRHGAERITLEIPGGLVDPGEPPDRAAARECLEETGYRAEKVRSLGSLNPNPALFGHRLHAFVAEGVEPVGEIQNTGREQTAVELVPAAELPRLLTEGIIDHALIAVTLWRYVYETSPGRRENPR